MRSPPAFSDISVKTSFLRTTPAKKPRTECCCQPVAFMMAAIVAPLGCLSTARTATCLVSPRVEPEGMFPGFAGLFTRLLASANLVFLGGRRPSARQRFRHGRRRTHPRGAGASRHRGRHHLISMLTTSTRASPAPSVRGYFTTPYDSKAVAGYVARLRLAEKLVFVFPQWWFNVPAILKGFFDRVLVPGVAFDHASGGGPLIH